MSHDPLITYATPEAIPTRDLTAIRIRRRDTDERLTFEGRAAWALGELVKAGRDGVTTLERPAPRWSDYVFKLRRAGIDIQTEHENHSGHYAGHHGRYRLLTPLHVLDIEEART